MSNSKHPLVGAFLHTFNDKGLVEYQARILDVKQGWYTVMLYDWVLGMGNVERLFPQSVIDKCRLYPDAESWRSEGARLSEQAARSAP